MITRKPFALSPAVSHHEGREGHEGRDVNILTPELRARATLIVESLRSLCRSSDDRRS